MSKFRRLELVPWLWLSVFALLVVGAGCGSEATNQKQECANPIAPERSDVRQLRIENVFGSSPVFPPSKFEFQDGMIWTEDFYEDSARVKAFAIPIQGHPLNRIAQGTENTIQSQGNLPTCWRLDKGGELLASAELPVSIQNNGEVPTGVLWQTRISANELETNFQMVKYPATPLVPERGRRTVQDYFLDNLEDFAAPPLIEGGKKGYSRIYIISDFEFEVRGYRKQYLGEPGKSALRTVYYRARYALSL